MTEVEQYEHIRREHELAGKSIREIAEAQGVHRRKVRRALTCAQPPERRLPERQRPVLTDGLRAAIDSWLEADRSAPRKQRHTARRIHRRLQAEYGFEGAESTIRRYVGQRRRELSIGREVFVPRAHLPGEEGEVDWYEADVRFPWGVETTQIFSLRACFSGREYHQAFPRQTQQAFLEGHAGGFTWMGGTFARVRYDNLKSAVARVLKGRQREEADRFVELRSHYLFESEFCRPGKEGAHEKGGVELELGRFRRTHLVPVPEFESYEALNRYLLGCCEADLERRLQGRSETVSQMWEAEATRLRALPAEPFDAREVKSCRVDTLSRVSVKTNHYSVPVSLSGRKVEVRLSALGVEVLHGGRVVAEHPRLQGLHGESLELRHYLPLLQVKPGALAGSRPLAQARARGERPEAWDRLWDTLRERHGDAAGTRQLLQVVELCLDEDPAEVAVAIELGLEYGCHDAAAIRVLLRQQQGMERPFIPLEALGALGVYEREASTDMSAYDALLAWGPAGSRGEGGRR